METKLQKTFSITLALLLTLALLPARIALAQTPKDDVPVGLLQAVLDSTAQPFQARADGGYTASASGLAFGLAAGSLQTQADGLHWGISLRGFGRGTRVADVSSPEVVQVGDKLEYQRLGLTEWYRDTALGLEQGFTIFQRPPGSGPFVLQLDLATDLKSVPDGDGHGLSFPAADGQTLRYDHLLVWDANGVALHARLVSQPGQVIIQVDDSAAAYPLTIDPLIYLEQKTFALDGAAGDNFGDSVALSGDTALVGANGKESAYVFVRSGNSWTQQMHLTASDGAAGDEFGYSVALSGDTALVGAKWKTVGTNIVQGSAYIFVRNGSTWTLQAKLTASDGAETDEFGYSVALSDNTALVGAVNADDGDGSAYIFVRSGTAWSQQAKLKPDYYSGLSPRGLTPQQFGNSVSLMGDTALVGMINDGGDSDSPGIGSAWVFVRSGTAWTKQAKLTPSDGEYGDQFGVSVKLSGNTALVGADEDAVGANYSQGSAYIFVRSGTTWSQQAHLTASDGAAYDNFGSSVALSADTAMVGAKWDTVGTKIDQGSAYIFVRSGTTWTQIYHLTASDGAANDEFGNSVALSDDNALVGAWRDTVGTNSNQGSAYFYQAYRTDSDLAVSAVRAGNAPLHAGDKVLLTTSIRNYGPASASAVLLTVALPTGLTYVSHTVTQGTYTPSKNSWMNSWSVGTLGAGAAASLTIQASVNALPASQQLTFAPFLLSRDTNDQNNTASLALPVYIPHEIATNGGFNTYVGTSKIPQNWSAANFATTDGKDTSVKKEGTASLKITGASGKSKTLAQTKSLSGTSGDEFQFSFWVKGTSIPAAGVCEAQILLYNGTTLKLTKTVACPTGTYAFQKKSLSFTATSVYTKVVIMIIYAKASGTVNFDGLSLMKAP